jgi:hypothetical protein
MRFSLILKYVLTIKSQKMKIYIKNMVCRGTKSFIIKELERLGFNYNTLDPGIIDFKNNLSFRELRKLSQTLSEYGLKVTLRDFRFVPETV